MHRAQPAVSVPRRDVVHYVLHNTPHVQMCLPLGAELQSNGAHAWLPLAPRRFSRIGAVVLNDRQTAVAGMVDHDGRLYQVTPRWPLPNDRRQMVVVVDGRGEDDDDMDGVEQGRPAIVQRQQQPNGVRLRQPLADGQLAVVSPATQADEQHLQQRLAAAPQANSAMKQQFLAELAKARQDHDARQAQADKQSQVPSSLEMQKAALQLRKELAEGYARKVEAQAKEYAEYLARERATNERSYQQGKTDAERRRAIAEADQAAREREAVRQEDDRKLRQERQENLDRRQAIGAALLNEKRKSDAQAAAATRESIATAREAERMDQIARTKRVDVMAQYDEHVKEIERAKQAQQTAQSHKPKQPITPVVPLLAYDSHVVFVAPDAFLAATQKRSVH